MFSSDDVKQLLILLDTHAHTVKVECEVACMHFEEWIVAHSLSLSFALERGNTSIRIFSLCPGSILLWLASLKALLMEEEGDDEARAWNCVRYRVAIEMRRKRVKKKRKREREREAKEKQDKEMDTNYTIQPFHWSPALCKVKHILQEWKTRSSK